MESRLDYAENGMIFALFSSIPVRLVVIGAENTSKMELGLLFHSRDSSFFAKHCVPSSPNNTIVGFWSLKGVLSRCGQALHFLQS